MSNEQKIKEILAAKERIQELHRIVRYCFDTKEPSAEINRWLRSRDKAYIKYNQLKFKYWIFI
jgi:hypothetical protein